MIFEFVDNGNTKEVEIDDECISVSYINLELNESLQIEDEDEDKTEKPEESN